MPALLFSLGFLIVVFMIFFIITTLSDPYSESLLKFLAVFFLFILVVSGVWVFVQIPW